jgi:hypothetical protein
MTRRQRLIVRLHVDLRRQASALCRRDALGSAQR